mmetsp:Transcript_38198/g.53030  ORF Transcript_38198/g.53030 Transcript_38198/m.53030 type:complete len:171 (+) Transcript_38198:3-515(+)
MKVWCSYVAALAHFSMRDTSLQAQQEAWAWEEKELQEASEGWHLRLQKIRQVAEQASRDQEEGEGRLRILQGRAKLLKEKTRQYAIQAGNSKEMLKRAGDRPELRHDALVKRAEEYHQLVAESAPLQVKLKSYQDLPPDKASAMIEIEKMRQRVCVVQAELENVCAAALE